MLGVGRDADQKAIKDAFRALALKHHPDRDKSAGAEERFKEIAQAYAVLSDPRKRSEYDARGFSGVAGFSAEDLFGNIDFEDLFGGLGLGFGGDSPFSRFFHRRPSGPRHGESMQVPLTLSLEHIANGGEETLHIARPVPCQACHGTGAKDGAAPTPCKACGGTGRITHSSHEDKQHVFIQQISTCPSCHGSGQFIEHPCPECQGSGTVESEESLTVKIPVGVEEGTALRIPGKGMPSPDKNGPPGDLFAVVRSRPDPRFERLGADLVRQESIALTDAVLGTDLTIPTLQGSARVTVPPGTQPDAVLRLAGKGLPAFGGGKHGDLYLRIGVRVPENLGREERALYEQLRTLARRRS
ncbi:DnaJ C-terminal domain-containing protein [Lacisediminimonas profundi]|uniref:DnaJ C-terminal domain-containing protein n=1 Tax=Lacisediminimonas profundi TaxID=2603856 RepID=UPI001F4FB95F|nr:DnaJ C-terminal domain-containing protein [Lacisediminimonas profundi]